MRSILIILFFFNSFFLLAPTGYPEGENKDVEVVFNKMEEGFIKGDISKLEPYIKDKVFISLFTGTAGYFSRNHAISLLDDLFTYYKSSGFYYISKKSDTDTPFASGKFKYFHKGILRNSNVFISLKKQKDNWIISQITID